MGNSIANLSKGDFLQGLFPRSMITTCLPAGILVYWKGVAHSKKAPHRRKTRFAICKYTNIHTHTQAMKEAEVDITNIIDTRYDRFF